MQNDSIIYVVMYGLNHSTLCQSLSCDTRPWVMLVFWSPSALFCLQWRHSTKRLLNPKPESCVCSTFDKCHNFYLNCKRRTLSHPDLCLSIFHSWKDVEEHCAVVESCTQKDKYLPNHRIINQGVSQHWAIAEYLKWSKQKEHSVIHSEVFFGDKSIPNNMTAICWRMFNAPRHMPNLMKAKDTRKWVWTSRHSRLTSDLTPNAMLLQACISSRLRVQRCMVKITPPKV